MTKCECDIRINYADGEARRIGAARCGARRLCAVVRGDVVACCDAVSERAQVRTIQQYGRSDARIRQEGTLNYLRRVDEEREVRDGHAFAAEIRSFAQNFLEPSKADGHVARRDAIADFLDLRLGERYAGSAGRRVAA